MRRNRLVNLGRQDVRKLVRDDVSCRLGGEVLNSASCQELLSLQPTYPACFHELFPTTSIALQIHSDMEKVTESSFDAEAVQNYQQSRPQERRFKNNNVVLVIIACLAGTLLWSTHIHPSATTPKHTCKGSLTVEQRATKVLRENPLIDGHNDLMIFIRGTYKNHIYKQDGSSFQEKFENGGLEQHVDIPRLEKGLQGGAFWSAFWPCPMGEGTNFADERYHDSKLLLELQRR